jgi:hypothetical protein
VSRYVYNQGVRKIKRAATMKKAIIITLITIIILAAGSWITSTAYGHTNDNTTLNATVEGDIKVTPAPDEDTPHIDFFGNYIGSVAAGDLFYINALENQPDFTIDLYITNTDGLVKSYRYMILKVTVYIEEAAGNWQEVNELNGIELPDQFITLDNPRVTFNLTGQANYKVTIESGSYKSWPHTTDDDVAPQFYLNTNLM